MTSGCTTSFHDCVEGAKECNMLSALHDFIRRLHALGNLPGLQCWRSVSRLMCAVQAASGSNIDTAREVGNYRCWRAGLMR